MNTKEILEKVKNGELEVNEAQELLNAPDYVCIDYDRQKRTGVPEVIYGAGKTSQQISGIIKRMLENHQTDILVTRLDKDKYNQIKDEFPMFHYDELSGVLYYQKANKIMNKGLIAVICAGTSDLPIANEATITAQFLGNEVIQINDVGVAGLHRLMRRMDDIYRASVIVVIAGMEGALASVVGGLVSAPVIAVPTSVGYGANFNGLSALLSMLNSCASGVSVVNIDNGFGAGYMAHTINCLGGKR